MTQDVFSVANECDTCRAKQGAPDLCSLCLRRRALRPGSLVLDETLLRVGDRVQFFSGAYNDPPRDWHETDGHLGSYTALLVRVGKCRFLGWAAKATVTTDETYTSYERAKAGSRCADSMHAFENGKAKLCGPGCEFAKTMPSFKRHPTCEIRAMHVAGRLCLGCEAKIASDQRLDDEERATRPVARAPYEPRSGAFVGRVLTP